ncbi:MAG: sensor domain-containing diguanylate cyclase [Thermodesulfobacteriota bacterium]
MARSKREITKQPSVFLGFLYSWLGCLMAFLGALAIGTTTLLVEGKPSVGGIIVLTTLALASSHYLLIKFGNNEHKQGQTAELEIPLIVIVASWSIFRFGVSTTPFLVLFPIAAMVWVTLRLPPRLIVICWLTALVMEGGQVLAGGQSAIGATMNILLCAAVAAGFYFLQRSKPYRLHRQKVRIDKKSSAEAREQVKELDLERDISTTGILQDLDSFDSAESFSRQTIDSINSSFEIQLEIIRNALELTTIAILWPSPDNEELRLRYLASSREDINAGPYPVGAGITGALSGDRDEAELAEVKTSHPAIPYYHKKEGVGAVLAIRIPFDEKDSRDNDKQRTGILCADRSSESPWSEREKQVLRLAASKIGLEIRGGRLLLNLDRERSAIHRLCLAFRELNSVLNLETIFDASVRALMAQAPVDALALCLREEEQFQVVRVMGDEFQGLADQYFPVSDGLVGQAMKTGRSLPVGGRYLSPAPIFSDQKNFTTFQSLLVIPLPDKNNPSGGCLVLASAKPNLFTRSRQQILELIATQIAIKLELGRAHEQLGKMATTDGLTGLANHRAFQHGYDVMLDRAKRTDTPLCLLMGDLDHFKKVNDNFGHPFGDHVLQKVAAVLAETVRTVDLAARYGGEEFALLLENCDADGGHVLAERIRNKIENLNLVCQEKPLTVTISIGISVFPENGSEKSVLIDRADKSLYKAKKTGRNQTVVWNDDTR